MAKVHSKVHHVTLEEKTVCAKTISTVDSSHPYFAVYDKSFTDILGSSPTIELVLEKDYPFAHEAGVYIPSQDAVFFTSNRFKPKGALEDSHQTIWISKITRTAEDGRWNLERVHADVAMGNGATNYKTGILFCDQGDKDNAGGLVYIEAERPYTAKHLIDGFHGRLFNSINDVVVHSDGSIWFTDPIYGFEHKFRNKPQLPAQVYRFNPTTADVQVVADGFGRPNGLCFSPDEKTMYITDTDYIHGDGTKDLTRAATIYAYDVIERNSSKFLANRRVFAMSDKGAPDGIKCDTKGNVYSGCGDGISVWNQGGVLLGKIVLPGGICNFCFALNGELICLNEHRLWVAKIDQRVEGALLSNMTVRV